jgi:hypothetical protein
VASAPFVVPFIDPLAAAHRRTATACLAASRFVEQAGFCANFSRDRKGGDS